MTKLCDECETVAHCSKHGCIPKRDFWEGYVPEPDKRQQALDKKAENARELGLDYEPAQQYSATSDHRLMENAQGELERIKLVQTGVGIGKPEQEPVAWLDLLREARDNCKASIVEEGISASRKEYRIDLESRLTAALNTSPPAQRTWVGLTDEERKLVRNSVGYNQFVTAGEYAEHVQKATEFKLKEKNT